MQIGRLELDLLRITCTHVHGCVNWHYHLQLCIISQVNKINYSCKMFLTFILKYSKIIYTGLKGYQKIRNTCSVRHQEKAITNMCICDKVLAWERLVLRGRTQGTTMPWSQAESNKYRDVHDVIIEAAIHITLSCYMYVGVAVPKRRGARHATEDKHK